jgi:hypothetical protein
MESHPKFSGVWIGSYRSIEWSGIHVLSLFNFYKHFVFVFMVYFCKTQLVSNRYLTTKHKGDWSSLIHSRKIIIYYLPRWYCVCVCVRARACVCAYVRSFWRESIVCFLYSAFIQQTVEQTQTVFVFIVSHGLVWYLLPLVLRHEMHSGILSVCLLFVVQYFRLSDLLKYRQ